MTALLWNKPSEMSSYHRDHFHAAGGWDDDVDWIGFVPDGMQTPELFGDIIGHTFNTDKYYHRFVVVDLGMFFAYYHS